MKQIPYFLLLIAVTIAGLWIIPELVKTATYSRDRYPFVYFSSTEKKLIFKEFVDKGTELHDDEGVFLTDSAYDHMLPLLNYRQLTLNGEMPDSIDGIAIDPRELRVKQIVYRYDPKDKNKPQVGLYIMYESLPIKGKLESPGDVFRLTDKIEFIDDATNQINRSKSEMFQKALEKAGYTFPAQWTSGNLSIRKPYDEGYFSLDAQGQLFHIKMVNGRPFVRNTQLDPSIEPTYFSMLEVSDKRFYGFLFDKNGKIYILEEAAGKYRPLPLDIPAVDLNRDALSIIGNLLYWTVSVENDNGKWFYGLKTADLQRVRESFVLAPVNRWDKVANKLFPFYLTFKKNTTHYVAPYLHFTAGTAFLLNALLALIVYVIPRRSLSKRIFDSLYVLLFGVAGVVAFCLIPRYQSKNNQHK